jgi:hypothetical protein
MVIPTFFGMLANDAKSEKLKNKTKKSLGITLYVLKKKKKKQKERDFTPNDKTR